MSNDAVVAMLVARVDDIKIAATIEVMDAVVADLNKRFRTKHSGEVKWYMGNEYRRDREKGTRVWECLKTTSRCEVPLLARVGGEGRLVRQVRKDGGSACGYSHEGVRLGGF